MTYRRLGASGLVVSTVGLGCNNFGRRLDLDRTREVVDAALDAGITFLDTADIYGESETLLGEVLAGRRDDVVVATKFGMRILDAPDWEGRASRRYVRRAVERSLRRLRTDYIDLYQLHLPDDRTPIAETLSAMSDLVREGKVRYLGCSNFAAWQLADAAWTARELGVEGFVSAQNHYSLLEREPERELVPACERFGVGVLPYYPLANGLLTGKVRHGRPPEAGTRLAEDGLRAWLSAERLATVEALADLADAWGVTMLELAIGGLAAKPAVASVIAGATRPEQVRANAAAAAWRPSAEQLDALSEVRAPLPAPQAPAVAAGSRTPRRSA
jgi:aryl-alcohol dehydrogenase-like predicted oxidoreductase